MLKIFNILNLLTVGKLKLKINWFSIKKVGAARKYGKLCFIGWVYNFKSSIFEKSQLKEPSVNSVGELFSRKFICKIKMLSCQIFLLI